MVGQAANFYKGSILVTFPTATKEDAGFYLLYLFTYSTHINEITLGIVGVLVRGRLVGGKKLGLFTVHISLIFGN